MNPLLDVRANLSANRKEFEHERSEYSSFKAQVDPILDRLQASPEHKQGFIARYFYSPPLQVKSLNEALENCKKIEESEVRLMNLQERLDKFDPEDGAILLLELNRDFEHIHESILKCRVNVVANIIRCDGAEATKLASLGELYTSELAEIRAKLDALEDLYRKVDGDFSGKYELKSDPSSSRKLTPAQARVTELHEHLQKNYDLNLKSALAKPLAKIAEIKGKIESAKNMEELEQYKIDLLVHQQQYDKAVLVFVQDKRGDVFVRAMIDEIDIQVSARGKRNKSIKRRISNRKTRY